jgi:hypothetical protein
MRAQRINVIEAARELIEKGLSLEEQPATEGTGAESRVMQLMIKGFSPCEIVAMGYNMDVVDKCYGKFLEWGRLEMSRSEILRFLSDKELFEYLMRAFECMEMEIAAIKKVLLGLNSSGIIDLSRIETPFLMFLARKCFEKKIMPSELIESFTGKPFEEVLENPQILGDKLREKRLGSQPKCNT